MITHFSHYLENITPIAHLYVSNQQCSFSWRLCISACSTSLPDAASRAARVSQPPITTTEHWQGEQKDRFFFRSPGRKKKRSGYCAWTNDKIAYYGAEKAGGCRLNRAPLPPTLPISTPSLTPHHSAWHRFRCALSCQSRRQFCTVLLSALSGISWR